MSALCPEKAALSGNSWLCTLLWQVQFGLAKPFGRTGEAGGSKIRFSRTRYFKILTGRPRRSRNARHTASQSSLSSKGPTLAWIMGFAFRQAVPSS